MQHESIVKYTALAGLIVRFWVPKLMPNENTSKLTAKSVKNVDIIIHHMPTLPARLLKFKVKSLKFKV